MEPEALKVLQGVAIAGLSLAISAALSGNVIRVRAQYAPKEEHPDAEDNREVMGVSFWRMLTRTFRMEGFLGLLRGICLLIFLTLVFITLFWLVGGLEAIYSLDPELRTKLGYALGVFFGVLFSIFYIRSITATELLPFFSLRRGMKALLSPLERRHPWVLYFTPGLFLVIALQQAWDFILFPILVYVISLRLPASDVGILPATRPMPIQVIANMGFGMLDTIIMTPLQVATVRLAVQRCEGEAIVLTDGPTEIPVCGRVTDGEAILTVGRVPVVRFRTQTEKPAYTGLLNCIASIVDEEGFDTLYRVWWYTFLTALVKVFVISSGGKLKWVIESVYRSM